MRRISILFHHYNLIAISIMRYENEPYSLIYHVFNNVVPIEPVLINPELTLYSHLSTITNQLS